MNHHSAIFCLWGQAHIHSSWSLDSGPLSPEWETTGTAYRDSAGDQLGAWHTVNPQKIQCNRSYSNSIRGMETETEQACILLYKNGHVFPSMDMCVHVCVCTFSLHNLSAERLLNSCKAQTHLIPENPLQRSLPAQSLPVHTQSLLVERCLPLDTEVLPCL